MNYIKYNDKYFVKKKYKVGGSDMAGTIINERGIIYRSKGETLKEMGCEVS